MVNLINVKLQQRSGAGLRREVHIGFITDLKMWKQIKGLFWFHFYYAVLENYRARL